MYPSFLGRDRSDEIPVWVDTATPTTTRRAPVRTRDDIAREQCLASGGVWNSIRYRCEQPPAPPPPPPPPREPEPCPEGWARNEYGACRPVPQEPVPYVEPEYEPTGPSLPVPEPEPLVEEQPPPPADVEDSVVVVDPETQEPVVVPREEVEAAVANGEVVQYWGAPAPSGGGAGGGSTRVTVQAPAAGTTDAAAMIRKWLPVIGAGLLLLRGGSS